MTNQPIESTTAALVAFSLAAPEVDATQPVSAIPAQSGSDVVARSVSDKVALEDWERSFERTNPGRNSGDDRPANVARNEVVGGATVTDTRLDDRAIPVHRHDESDRRHRPPEPEPEPEPSPGESGPSIAPAGYALDDIVRFDGKTILFHRDDMRDEPWPLSAHS